MHRLTTKHVVVIVPLLAALLLTGGIWISRARLNSSIERFKNERFRNGWAHVGNLEATDGTIATRRVLRELSSRDTQLVFDGANRFAQIIDARYTPLNADGIAVYALGDHLVTRCEYGPAGAKIVNIQFDNNVMVIDYVFENPETDSGTDQRNVAVRQNRIRWDPNESADSCVPFSNWMH